jgi:hypothetical protein
MRTAARVLCSLLPILCVVEQPVFAAGRGEYRAEEELPPSLQPKTVFITEVMSANTLSYDLAGETPDWIELHNYGETTVLLQDFGISDDPTVLFRYRFGEVALEPDQTLRVWADGGGQAGARSTGGLQNTGGAEEEPLYVDPDIHVGFGVNKDGETLYLTHPDGVVIDTLHVPPLERNVTFGRLVDDPSVTAVLTDPTPGVFASQYARESDLPAAPPVFSRQPGFHTEHFALAIESTDPNARIFYTLDGSIPDESSFRYGEPIDIRDRSGEPDRLALIRNTSTGFRLPQAAGFKGTVVRAVSYTAGRPRSPVVTGTWFVAQQGRDRYTMPVISIATDDEGLFDYESGIYVLGQVADRWREQNPGRQMNGGDPANYNQRGKGWSVVASIEIFDGESTTAAEARVRTLGGWSRANPVKSLRLDFDEPLECQLFPELPIDRFYSLVLRTSANDWETTLLRDAFFTSLAGDLLETQASRPAVVFLNGEYWGIHNIRERMTTEYFESHFDIPAENVVVLENWDEVAEGRDPGRTSYAELMDTLWRHDLAEDDDYAYAQSVIDVDNYIDYMATQIYIANLDWPGNNVRFWQDIETGTLWRWILYDTDFGFDLYNRSGGIWNDTLAMVLDPTGPEWPNPPWATLLFRSLYANHDFRNEFLTRLCDFLNSRFRSDVVVREIESFAAQYRPEMAEHISRWRIMGGNVDSWELNIRRMLAFAEGRPDALRRMVIRDGHATGDSVVRLDVPSGGSVQIASLEGIREAWSGVYFDGIPLSVLATPDRGYRFVRWEGDAPSSDATIEIVPAGDTVLRPVFTPVGE